MTSNRSEISERIKKLARRIGFSDCGITPARLLSEDSRHLKKWLRLEMNGGMKYMENHFEKRSDPSKLVPDAKSAIVVLLNYYPKKQQDESNDNLLISKYAYGKDYHQVMKEMLKKFLKIINEEIILCHGRVFVDSAPVLERALAAKAGLGWIGKNSNLISPRYGSFVFIGEILVDILLEYDKPHPDYCGSCSQCIDTCPTRAIISPKKLDSRKCLSYLTIEHKGTISNFQAENFKNRIFGCDICQDVCPWNRKCKPTKMTEFQPPKEMISLRRKDWHNLSEEKYRELFENTAVSRTGFEGLIRNIRYVTS